MSETGTQSAARYRGVVPMRQRCVKMMTLYLTCSGTSSQWRLLCISCVKPRWKLPGTCQNACCCIHHALQFVGDDLRSPGENDITEVHTWCYKVVDECRRRLRGEHPPNVLESTMMAKASCIDVSDMLVKAEISRDDNSKHSDVLLGVITSTASCRDGKVKSCRGEKEFHWYASSIWSLYRLVTDRQTDRKSAAAQSALSIIASHGIKYDTHWNTAENIQSFILSESVVGSQASQPRSEIQHIALNAESSTNNPAIVHTETEWHYCVATRPVWQTDCCTLKN